MNNGISFFERDSRLAEMRKFNLAKYLTYVKEHKNKSFSDQLREFRNLRKQKGSLDVNDYFYYRLYDDDLYTWDEKTKFISTKLFWKYTPICCPPNWWLLSEDKWVMDSILRRHLIPAPETMAVVGRGMRSFGNVTTISTPAQLGAFLMQAELPLFTKTLGGMGSAGATVIEGFTDDTVQLAQEDDLDVDAFFEMISRGRGYIIQKVVKPHQDLIQFGDFLGTVRLINFVFDDHIATPHAIWKIIANNNIADNYWRSGNMMAALAIETGTVERVVSGSGPEIKEHTDHPTSGSRMVGFQLPYWNDVLELNRRCAGLFAPLRFNSLDVGITDDGPVVIEVNVGSAFSLPQLATGRGFLTDEACAFFEYCGIELGPRRRRMFRART